MTYQQAKQTIQDKFKILEDTPTTTGAIIDLTSIKEISDEDEEIDIAVELASIYNTLVKLPIGRGNWEHIQVVSIDIAAELAGVDLTPFRDEMDDDETDYIIPWGIKLPKGVSIEAGNVGLIIRLSPEQPAKRAISDDYQVKCARTACGATENVVYRHSQTGALFCAKCARAINEFNPGICTHE